MQGDLDHPPIVVRRSCVGLGLRLLFFGAFAVLGLLVMFKPGARISGVAGFGFLVCAILAFYCGWAFFNPDKLILSPDGLRWVGPKIDRSWQWQEISEVTLYSLTAYAKSIRFEVGQQHKSPEPSRRTRRALSPSSRTISGTPWEIRSDRLADLLNQARARWG